MTTFKHDIVTKRQAAFLEFCLDQPSKRLIDHHGWANCTLGDYHRERDGGKLHKKAVGENGQYYSHPAGYSNWTDYAQRHIPVVLYRALDVARRTRTIPTYGELARRIRIMYVERGGRSILTTDF